MICVLCHLGGFRQGGNNSVTWVIATCVFSARLHFLRKQTQFLETKNYFIYKSTAADVVVWGSTGAVTGGCRKVWDGQHGISCLMNNLYSIDRRIYIYIFIHWWGWWILQPINFTSRNLITLRNKYRIMWVSLHTHQYKVVQTGTDLCVNKPHCAAAVRPWESEATTSTLPPARVRTCSVLSGSC